MNASGGNRVTERRGFSQKPAQGRLPSPLPDSLRINLGCSRQILDGFVNIDLYSDDERVVCMDLRRLALPDECAETVHADYTLQRFPHPETKTVLAEWIRVLKVGAELFLRVPSFRGQAKAYAEGVWNAETAARMIFGGQENEEDCYRAAFDPDSITLLLDGMGVRVTEIQEKETRMQDGELHFHMTVRARKVRCVSVRAAESSGGPRLCLLEKPCVFWEGPQFVDHAFGLVNREVCYRLIGHQDLRVILFPHEDSESVSNGDPKNETLLQHEVGTSGLPKGDLSACPVLWVRHGWPLKETPPTFGKWVLVMPLASGTMPETWAGPLKEVEEIWTPSTYSRNAFLRSGVEASKVHVLPNGFDPAVFHPIGEKAELPTRKRFRFLFVGATIFRKGIDILLESYVQHFSPDDDVCLVIKDAPGVLDASGKNARDFIEKLRKNPKLPEIVVIDEHLSDRGMAALYRACHAAVFPYRGEAFVLPALEAMACGLPVIATHGGATDDFVDDSVGWSLKAVEKNVQGLDNVGDLLPGGTLLEPDTEDLVRLLLHARHNSAELIRKGSAAATRAHESWHWDAAVARYLRRIETLCGLTRPIETSLSPPLSKTVCKEWAKELRNKYSGE